MVKPSNYLAEAVRNKNMLQIYNEFYNIAHEDRGFKTGKFLETLEFVKKQDVPGFIQPFDNREFGDREKWDEDYWALVASSLMDNFSLERINHLKEVGIYLYGDKKSLTPSGPKPATASAPQNAAGVSGSSATSPRPKVEVYKESKNCGDKLAVAGLAAAGLLALVMGKKSIGFLLAIATVGTGVFLYGKRNK